MNLTEYQNEAKKTSPKHDDLIMGILNYSMGLCGEIAEVKECIMKNDTSNLIIELGDVMWYISQIYTLLDVQLDDIYYSNIYILDRVPKDIETISNNLYIVAGEIIDYMKKVIFHDHSFDEYKIINLNQDAFLHIQGLCNVSDIQLEYVCETNIDKLRKRYGTSFSCEKSINRVV